MTVAIIPAKGESTRIPGKNMKPFCRQPLFTWSVEQALNSKLVDMVFVTSDDDSILITAGEMGSEIILRPYEYTLTPANQALQHAIDEIERRGIYPDDFVCLLPTSPIRLPHDIDNMIRLHHSHSWRATGTVCKHLETIVYEPTENGFMKVVIFDKQGKYYQDGGGMSVTSVGWYKTWKVPSTDKEYDQNIYDGKFTPPEDIKYILKEWQTPELDMPDHWLEAEAIMEACILHPYGHGCYKNYYYSEGENNE